MISEDELAAIVAALRCCTGSPDSPDEAPPSRWKRAARETDLELEDWRVR